MSSEKNDIFNTNDQNFKQFGKNFNKGDIIFREGEMGQEMFILQFGEVLISRKVGSKDKPLTTLKQGDFFGEMALLNNQPRSASALALKSCRCLVFDAQTFENMIQNYAKVAFRMIKKLSERLRQTNALIENLLLKDDYSKITNSLFQLMQMGKLKKKNGVQLKDLAVQAGVSETVAQNYFSRLRELGIANLEGENERIEVVDNDRLERLQKYLTMRAEFIALEKPKNIKDARIAYF